MRHGFNKDMMQMLCLQQCLHRSSIQSQLIQLMPYDILLLRMLQQIMYRIQRGRLSMSKGMRTVYMNTASCFQLFQIKGNKAVVQAIGRQ